MYSKKYTLDKVEEFGQHNCMYDSVEGSLCYLAYLHVGERGWFLFYRPDIFRSGVPHRVHTSTVKDVEYFDDRVIVTTQNTKFIFKVIAEATDE